MAYEVTDTYLAGYLMASGEILASSRKNAGQTTFCFEQTDRLLQLVQGYFDMTGKISPLQYGGALKVLKSIIYQKDKDNHHGNFHNIGATN